MCRDHRAGRGQKRALEFMELESQLLCGYWESNLGAEDNSRNHSVLSSLDWVPGIEFMPFSLHSEPFPGPDENLFIVTNTLLFRNVITWEKGGVFHRNLLPFKSPVNLKQL